MTDKILNEFLSIGNTAVLQNISTALSNIAYQLSISNIIEMQKLDDKSASEVNKLIEELAREYREAQRS